MLSYYTQGLQPADHNSSVVQLAWTVHNKMSVTQGSCDRQVSEHAKAV